MTSPVHDLSKLTIRRDRPPPRVRSALRTAVAIAAGAVVLVAATATAAATAVATARMAVRTTA